MKRPSVNSQQFLLQALMRLQAMRTSEQGFIVFFVASVVVLLGFLWVAYGLLSRMDSSSTAASLKSNTGFYAAEYGLNLRAKDIRNKFEGYNRPIGTTPANWKNCTSSSASQGSDDFRCENLEIQNQTVSTYVEEKTVIDPLTGFPRSETVPLGQPFAGLVAQYYRFNVISVAQDGTEATVRRLTDANKRPTASLKMRFSSLLIPLFQFAVFSENDADFSLPPDMNLNGPVHSNSSLYLNAAIGRTFTIRGQVTVVNQLFRGRKDVNSCTGTLNVFNGSSPASTPLPLACEGRGRRDYPQADLAPWNNQIIVGVNKLEVPKPDELDPSPGRLYWDNADLRVVLKVQDDPSKRSGARAVSIEIWNQNRTLNTSATAQLRACYPAVGSIPGIADISNYDSIASSITLDPPVTTAQRIRTNNAPLLLSSSLPPVDIITNPGFDNPNDIVLVSPSQAGADANSDGLIDNGSGNLNILQRPDVSTSLRLHKALLWSSDTFFNYREKINASGGTLTGPNAGRYIRMLNVDMQDLIDCVHSQGLMNTISPKSLDDTTDGGLVWFFAVENESNPAISRTNVITGGIPNNYGVRFYNASRLQSTIGGAPTIRGLTVVSDQAVYIQGNYNSTGKIPAAVLTDTINVLSENWKLDDRSTGRIDQLGNLLPVNPATLGVVIAAPNPLEPFQMCVGVALAIGCNAPPTILLRNATPTTINAAFLSGLEIPGGSNGVGSQDNNRITSGIHNYPRFHENWTGVPMNYRGSLVTLNIPRKVNSPFCGSLTTNQSCNIYAPPNRNWDYDTDFNDAAKLPPLTPRAVYLQQDAFGREFNVASIDVYRGVAWLPNWTRLGLGFPQLTGTVSVGQ